MAATTSFFANHLDMNSTQTSRPVHIWDLKFENGSRPRAPRGDEVYGTGTWDSSSDFPYSGHLSIDEPPYEPEELKDDQPQPLQRQLQSPGVNGNANSAADQDGYMDEMVVRERQPPNLQATAATPNSNSGSRTNSLSTNTQSTEFAAATPSSTTYESDSTRAIENLQQINDL